jgi:hypothetical protein
MKKNIIIATTLVALSGITMGLYFATKPDKPTTATQSGSLPTTGPVAQLQPSTPVPKPPIDNTPAKPSDNTAINAIKEADPKTTTPVVPVVPTSDTLIVTMTRSALDADGIVRVRGLVSGATTGTCTVDFRQGSVIKTITSTMIAQLDNYGCGAMDIKKTDMGTGKWDVSLYATSAGVKSKTANAIIDLGN